MNDFASAAVLQTVIIPVLNGMQHMDVLNKKFGSHAVLSGVCYVAMQVDSQGRVVQLNDSQKLIYGRRPLFRFASPGCSVSCLDELGLRGRSQTKFLGGVCRRTDRHERSPYIEERFIAQKARDVAEHLTSRTSFGMTG